MPALAPLLSHGGVLRAADRRHGEIAGHADIAADAFANVVETTFLDLFRQERIGNRGPRRADHVENALVEQAHHAVDRGIAADADHGLGRQPLHAEDERLLRALLRKARGAAVVFPAGKGHVPEVRQVGHQADHVLDFFLVEPALAHQLIDGNADRHRASIAHRRLRLLGDLAQEPDAVFNAAAIFVGPLVIAARQEVVQKAQRMGGIDIDEVEARPLRTVDRRQVPLADVPNVRRVHSARLYRVVGEGRDGQMGGPHGHFARIEVGAVHAVISKLDTSERSAFMDLVHHARQSRDIAVIPKAQLDERRDLGTVVKLHLLGADDRPTSFGLHAAHMRQRRRVAIPHAIAMRHLIKPVPSCHRTDLHRLEQDIVTIRSFLRCSPMVPVTHIAPRHGISA